MQSRREVLKPRSVVVLSSYILYQSTPLCRTPKPMLPPHLLMYPLLSSCTSSVT